MFGDWDAGASHACYLDLSFLPRYCTDPLSCCEQDHGRFPMAQRYHFPHRLCNYPVSVL